MEFQFSTITHTQWKSVHFTVLTRGGSRIPRRRGRQPSGRGRQPTILPNFPQKLHENEKISGRRGGRVPGAPPLRSATVDTLGYSLRTVVYPPKGRSDCVANHRRSRNMCPIHSNSPTHSVRNYNYRHSSRQNYQGSLDFSFCRLALEFLKRKSKQKKTFS